MAKQCAHPSSLKSRSQLRYTKTSSSNAYLRKSGQLNTLLASKLHRTSSSHCRDRTSPRNVHFAPGTVVATYAKELPPSDSFHLPNDMGEDQAALDGMGLEGDEVHDVDEVAMILLGLRDHQKSWGCGVLCRCRGRSCL